MLNPFTGRWQPPETKYGGTVTVNFSQVKELTDKEAASPVIAQIAQRLDQDALIYIDNNPKTQFGVKKVPLDLVPPSVEHALAEAFSLGAKKYGPYNWREKRVSASVYYSAALRHIKAWWDGEDLDPESGFPHLSHVLACIGIMVDAKSIGKLNDNRPPKGAASDLQKQWLARNE